MAHRVLAAFILASKYHDNTKIDIGSFWGMTINYPINTHNIVTIKSGFIIA